MEKNIVIILVAVAVVIVLLLGWWFFTRTNSVNIPNPGSLALPAGNTGNTGNTGKSPEKQITSFKLSGVSPEVNGVFDNVKNTITFNVPSDVDVTSLAPEISVSGNATISPVSGSYQDFTDPVTYTVTAQDGTTQTYTVIVNTIAPQGPVQGS
jgi:predicted permease